MKLKKLNKIKKKTNKPQKSIKKKSGAKLSGKNTAWQKVKLTGNLLSDEGGAGLEGLIGLEVLENYGNDLSVIREKPKREKKKVQIHSSDSEDNEDGEKPRKKKKKSKKVKADKAPDSAPTAGRFVLLKPSNGIEKTNKMEKKKIKAKNIESNSQTEVNDTTTLTIDDLVGWNGLGVPEEILRVMAEKGFHEPTEIQAQTLPAAILGRRDILGAAETGSGKTLAFGIPILNGILQLKKTPGKQFFRKISKSSKTPNKEQRPVVSTAMKKWKPKRNDRDNWTPPPEEVNNFPNFQESDNNDEIIKTNIIEKPLFALILTPTRELAVQVRDHLVAAAKYTGIKVCAIFGGLAAVKQERVLSKCPEIVVATPGRLWELLGDGNEHLNKIDNINFLVIDETDRMIEKGHFEELQKILDRLNMDPVKKSQRQHFIFSATLTLVHDLPEYLQVKNMTRKRKLQKQTAEEKAQSLIDYFGISQPKIIDITPRQTTGGTAERLTECRITCSFEHKDFYLYYFLQRHPGRTIVFCNSIESVRRLTQLFTILNCEPRALHAKMAQRQRLKNLEKFSKNPTGLLVATDVAARGLDIPNVDHVIHYQVPRTSENYIHRSGRTARGQNEGIAVLMMEPGEIREYMKLCRTLNRSDDLPMFPIEDRYLSVVRDRVALARQLDKLELKARRSKSDIGWLKKTAKEMDILIDDQSDFSEGDLYGSDDEGGVVERSKDIRILKQKREQLKKMLAKPIFPKGFSFKYPNSRINDNQSAGETAGPADTNGNDFSSKYNAVDVMKNAIHEIKQAKKLKNKKTKY